MGLADYMASPILLVDNIVSYTSHKDKNGAVSPIDQPHSIIGISPHIRRSE